MPTKHETRSGRRTFLRAGGLAIGTLFTPGVLERIESAAQAASLSAEEAAADERLWLPVQQAFSLDGRYIILNAGASNPMPRPVHEALTRYVDFVNGSPLINNRVLAPQRETVRRRLARLVNVAPDEIALTRGTTEGVNIVISGLRLKRGDEIVACDYDYGSMLNILRQRAARDGIVVQTVPLQWPIEDQRAIVNAYTAAITPRTRAIFCSHVIDAFGHIMPVQEIVRVAKDRGLQTIVDGALGFGHVKVDLEALSCDYYATSLHKWLAAPLGTGFLYVRRDRIADLWPLFGNGQPESDDIRKFESIGQHPQSSIAAIGPALDFYEAVGIERKQARLHYLKRYWTDQLASNPRVRFNTSLDPTRSGAIIHVTLDGLDAKAASTYLLEERGIYALSILRPREGVQGIYVSPNLFTTLAQLDQFVAELSRLLKDGVPARG